MNPTQQIATDLQQMIAEEEMRALIKAHPECSFVLCVLHPGAVGVSVSAQVDGDNLRKLLVEMIRALDRDKARS